MHHKHKKTLTMFREGSQGLVEQGLFFVALGAFLHTERLGAVMTGTAEFPCLHVLHCHSIGALFHFEYGRMAFIALCRLVSVSAKDNLPRALTVEINGLSRPDSKRRTSQYKREQDYHDENHRLFHWQSPPSIVRLFMVVKPADNSNIFSKPIKIIKKKL
jgi:hypothetical protein